MTSFPNSISRHPAAPAWAHYKTWDLVGCSLLFPGKFTIQTLFITAELEARPRPRRNRRKCLQVSADPPAIHTYILHMSVVARSSGLPSSAFGGAARWAFLQLLRLFRHNGLGFGPAASLYFVHDEVRITRGSKLLFRRLHESRVSSSVPR